MTLPPDLDTAVDHCIHAADALNEMLSLDPDDIDWREAASQLARLRHARKLLQTLEGSYEAFIGGQAPYGESELVGVGLVNVRKSPSLKWDHDRTAAAVLDAHLSGGTGEVPDPWTVRDWLMEAAAFAYWRKTPLRALGIDPDEYAEKTPGRWTVQIIPATGATDATTPAASE